MILMLALFVNGAFWLTAFNEPPKPEPVVKVIEVHKMAKHKTRNGRVLWERL